MISHRFVQGSIVYHTRGITLKALGCNDFCGTISATAVLMMPTFPFAAPPSILAIRAIFSDCEKPSNIVVAIVHAKLVKMTGFRPNRSDAVDTLVRH